jgi:hypothetical protein
MKTLNYGGQLSISDVACAVLYQCRPRTRANNVFLIVIYTHFYLPFVQ